MKKHNERYTGMEHLDERTIELYVLNSPEVKSQRRQITRHLKICPGCVALRDEIGTYYSEVAAIGRRRRDRESTSLYFPRRVLQRTPAENRSPAPSPGLTLPQRAVNSIRRYPVRWTTGLVALVAILLLLLPRLGPRADNPTYVRAREEFLIAFNNQGEELWRRHFGLEYDLEKMPSWIATYPERGLTVVDTDGDGINEVLAIFGWMTNPAPDGPLQNVIMCLNADGSERWRYTVHRDLSVGGIHYSDDFAIRFMAVGDYDRDGEVDIVLLASHKPWFPNVLIRLRARDGSFVSEYWHHGIVPHFAHKDIDGDGVDELLFAGQNNRFGRACLLVLDIRTMHGHAPSPPDEIPEGIPAGSEEYYLLFPATDFQIIWSDITNAASSVSIRADGLIEVVVVESLQDYRPTVYYYFDNSVRCVMVRASDHFTAVHRQFQEEGKLTRVLDREYFEELRRGVLYWDGREFVAQPTRRRW